MNTERSSRAESTLSRKRGWILAAFAICSSAALVLTMDPQVAQAQPNVNDRTAARRAAVDAARGQVDAATSELRAASERIRAAWTSRPEMLRAQLELDQARAELDRVSGPAYEKLRQSDAYKQAMQEETAATQRVLSERTKTESTQPAATQPATLPAGVAANDNRPIGADETDLNVALPSDGQINAAANRLDVVTKRRKMEEEAAHADPATADARARFEKATAEVRALQMQMRAAVLNDPEYKAAQERLNAAKADVARAGAATY